MKTKKTLFWSAVRNTKIKVTIFALIIDYYLKNVVYIEIINKIIIIIILHVTLKIMKYYIIAVALVINQNQKSTYKIAIFVILKIKHWKHSKKILSKEFQD